MTTTPSVTYTCIAVLGLLSSVVEGQAQVVFDYTFDASADFTPIDLPEFDIPDEGRFCVTLIDPDASLDGRITVIIGGDERGYLDGMHFGYTGVPAFPGATTVGLPARVIEFSADQHLADLGPLSFRMTYTPNGTENIGTNRVILEYIPQTITTPTGLPVLSITSGPMEPNCEGPVEFDAGLRGGFLVTRKTAIGDGGGGHAVYVDGLGYGYTQNDIRFGNPTSPEYYILEVGPGLHVLELCHNDTVWGDNSGTRVLVVFFVPTCPGDLTKDGTVGILDFLMLLGNWGGCP